MHCLNSTASESLEPSELDIEQQMDAGALEGGVRTAVAQFGGERFARSLLQDRQYETLGYALAMRVMQSELYPKLDARERSECDEFIRIGQEAGGVLVQQLMRERVEGYVHARQQAADFVRSAGYPDLAASVLLNWAPGFLPPKCPSCGGSGDCEVFVQSGGSMPWNAGDGHNETGSCPDCKGEGLDYVVSPVAPAAESFLQRVLRCRYPVCTSINPSGFGWDTPRLNEVIADFLSERPFKGPDGLNLSRPVAPAPDHWQPSFDAISHKQEQLVQQFCAEIAGPRGHKGSPPDPIRLLEMAQALYEAEREDEGPAPARMIGLPELIEAANYASGHLVGTTNWAAAMLRQLKAFK